MDRLRAVEPLRLTVALLVVQILVSSIILVVVVVRLPPIRCAATVVLNQVLVGQDTDPDSVYGANSTDSWWGNVTFVLTGSGGSVFHLFPVDLEGDTGHNEVVGTTAGGVVANKDEAVNYVFGSDLFERDGSLFGGPLPWDIRVTPPATGSLRCPGTYVLPFVVLFWAANSGEPETQGWLIFAYSLVLDP